MDSLGDLFEFLDSNIRYVKNVPYVIGGLVVIGVARRLRMVTKFTSAESIPSEFISRNVSLRGKVVQVTADRRLIIDHKPVLAHRWMSKGYLDVKMAGIEYSEDCSSGIHRTLSGLINQDVWFKLSQKLPDNGKVEGGLFCIVKLKKWPFNECYNTKLVKLGFARPCTELVHSGNFKMSKRLMKADQYAQKKNLGMWETPSQFELLKRDLKFQKEKTLDACKSVPIGAKKKFDGIRENVKKFF